MQRCIRIDSFCQQGNRKIVNNVKMGAGRPIQLGKFVHFIVHRVRLSCREVHQKRIFHQNGVQGSSGLGSKTGGAAREIHGRISR